MQPNFCSPEFVLKKDFQIWLRSLHLHFSRTCRHPTQCSCTCKLHGQANKISNGWSQETCLLSQLHQRDEDSLPKGGVAPECFHQLERQWQGGWQETVSAWIFQRCRLGKLQNNETFNSKWNCISERVLYLQPFPFLSFHSPLEHGVRDPCGNWHVDWGHVPEADLEIFSWWFSLFELQQEHWDQVAPRFNLRTSLFLKTRCWKGQAHGHSSFVVTASDEKTKENVADLNTKILSAERRNYLMKKIGFLFPLWQDSNNHEEPYG